MYMYILSFYLYQMWVEKSDASLNESSNKETTKNLTGVSTIQNNQVLRKISENKEKEANLARAQMEDKHPFLKDEKENFLQFLEFYLRIGSF